MKVIYTGLKSRPLKLFEDEHLFTIMANREIDEVKASQAFHELIERYGNLIWHICLRFCSLENTPQEVAKDIYRWTMYKAFIHANKFQNKKNTKAWLCTIAQHIYVDYLREKSDTGIIQLVEEYHENGHETIETEWLSRCTPEQAIKFNTAWKELDEHKREVLRTYLRYFNKNDFGKNTHLPKHEAEALCKAFPKKLKNKYYLSKVRDRAYEELYKKCHEK